MAVFCDLEGSALPADPEKMETAEPLVLSIALGLGSMARSTDFMDFEGFRFVFAFFCCSSSLRLVYNGSGEALLAPQAVQLKIIDFAHVLAHVRRGAFSDSGYIEGLRKVISLLEDISHARHMEFPIAKPAQAV